MKYRTLGRTGWQISEIACGTYQTFDVRGPVGRAQVLNLMRANLAEGVNLFDSAPMYGHSEANIGAALDELDSAIPPSGRRIATKVLQRERAGARQQIDRSFSVIGGAIDLLQIHNMAGWQRVLPLLVELKEQGRIGAIGVTHYDPAGFGEMEQAMKTGQVDVIQIPYNLLERQVERRILPLARDLNLGILVMTPLRPLIRRADVTKLLEQVELTPCRAYGVSDSGALCLKWLLSIAPELILLPATSRTERVHSNAAITESPPLPPELLRQIDRIFS